MASWASHTCRSQPKPVDASASAQRRDGRADVLQRWTGSVGCSERIEAQAMCCERMPHVAFVARNPCYASVFAKRSDGRTCAAAMDGHAWAAVNGRKYKCVVDVASVGRDSNLCDDFASANKQLRTDRCSKQLRTDCCSTPLQQAAANRPLQHTRSGFRSNDKPTNRQMWCKCDVSTNKCCKKHDSSETLPHLTHFDSLLQEHGLSSIDLSSSLLLALFFISYSAPLRVGRDCLP